MAEITAPVTCDRAPRERAATGGWDSGPGLASGLPAGLGTAAAGECPETQRAAGADTRPTGEDGFSAGCKVEEGAGRRKEELWRGRVSAIVCTSATKHAKPAGL